MTGQMLTLLLLNVLIQIALPSPSGFQYLVGQSKMAPRMAASVCWCALFCLVLFVKTVFCQDTCSSYTREELMNIRITTPSDLFPSFLMGSVELLDILVKGALTFASAVKHRKRGKRARVFVRLRHRRLRTALPGIFLSNVRSLCNKVDELQLLVGRNRDFSTSSVLCFTREDLYTCAGKIVAHPSHPGHSLFETLPSGKRLRSIRAKTSRHRNSFFPSAAGLVNKAPTPLLPSL